MKRMICLLLCVVMGLGVLSSCTVEQHVHTYDRGWSKDADSHWHKATCEHTEEISGKAAHADANLDSLCDTCGYVMQSEHTHTFEEAWTITDDNHYHKSTCGHTEEIDGEGRHVDNNNDSVCDVCAYDYAHTHTYADTLSSDGSYHWYAVTCGHAVEVKGKALHADDGKDGVCDVCAYVICAHTYANEWSTDETHHWYANTCTLGCTVTKDKAEHVDDDKNGLCDTCAYVVCAHTYADTWSTDDDYHWKEVTCGCTVSAGERGQHIDNNIDGLCDTCAFVTGHFHTFDEEVWLSGDTTHWHPATCEHVDVRGMEADHGDADDDGVCDVCEYVIFTRHTVTPICPSYVTVTDANNNPLTGPFTMKNNETKTILVTVPNDAILAMVLGATQVGEPAVVDGGKVYTYEIARPTDDVTVKVAANRLEGALVVEQKDDVLPLNGMITYGTISFYAPRAGKYFIYDPGQSDMEFGPAGSTTMNDYSSVYYFEVDEAGEFTLGIFMFTFDSVAEMEYSYLICQFEDEFIMGELEGEGYSLPNNVVIKLSFIAPTPGRYQIGSSASNLAWGDANATQAGDMVQGLATIVDVKEAGETVTVTLLRESVADVTFDFDWTISNLSDSTDVNVGENPMTLPNGNYVSVSLTAPADGSYTFAFSSIYSHIFLWMEEYQTMYDMGHLYTAMDVKAGDVITLFLSAVDDNMDGDDVTMTDDVEDTLVIIDMSTIMGEDGAAKADADGEENKFMADYDGGDYIFTAPEGVTMSFDGGNTWVSAYTATLEANQTLVFLVKTADGAETATLSVEQIAYWLDLEAVDNAVTYTFTMYPDREYSISIYGLDSSNISIAWGGADITAAMDGRPFVEGDTMSYSPWMNTISLTLHADGPVEITLTVQGK